MKTIATNEAKTHLSSLLKDVQQGETIIISRGRQPIAKLVPHHDTRTKRPKVGEMLDTPMHVPEEALASLSDDELSVWGLQ